MATESWRAKGEPREEGGEEFSAVLVTSRSPPLHAPCQHTRPYLSATELSHWLHTWPCHYLVPGFVSALLSPFCVFPDFCFPHSAKRDKNSLLSLSLTQPLSLYRTHKHTRTHPHTPAHTSIFLPPLFMKGALCFFQSEAPTVTLCGRLSVACLVIWRKDERIALFFYSEYKAYLMLCTDALPLKQRRRTISYKETGRGGSLASSVPSEDLNEGSWCYFGNEWERVVNAENIFGRKHEIVLDK